MPVILIADYSTANSPCFIDTDNILWLSKARFILHANVIRILTAHIRNNLFATVLNCAQHSLWKRSCDIKFTTNSLLIRRKYELGFTRTLKPPKTTCKDTSGKTDDLCTSHLGPTSYNSIKGRYTFGNINGNNTFGSRPTSAFGSKKHFKKHFPS